MSYQVWSVVFGEQPSASKWNILGTNDASFNDGTGIADDKILTRHILNANVTSNKLGLTTNSATDSGSNNTTSTTLVSTGAPSFSITVGANGKLLIGIHASIDNNTANNGGLITVALSGANTVAGADPSLPLASTTNDAIYQLGDTMLVTGLTAGATTITMQYRVFGGAGTLTIQNRKVWAVAL